MATTTPNYGWDVPTSTDYVKDGAVAIETLGDDIDASVWSITGGKNVGLVHLNTTTFSGASSVSVNSVFSSSYDSYRMVMEIVGSANANLYLRVRASGTDNSATQYGYSYPYFFMVPGTNGDLRGIGSSAVFLPGLNSGTTNSYFYDVQNIAKATTTQFTGTCVRYNSEAGYLTFGYNNASTAYDGLTIYPASGTMTGKIQIYGYRNS